VSVFLIGIRRIFLYFSFVSHRWRCDKVLMIPLGEFLHVLFEFCFFPLLVFGIKVFYMP